MNLPKGKALIPYLFAFLVAFLNVVGFICLITGLHKRFAFFTVTSVGRMIFYSLMVLLPLFVSVVIILLYKHIVKKTKITLFAFLATSVIVSMIFVVAFSIMSPCGSLTKDPDNYLVLDESSPVYFVSYIDFLPKQIPASAENVSYLYRYSNSPDVHSDIFVQWTMPRDDYNAEKSRLLQNFPNVGVEQSGKYDVVYISDEKKTNLDHMGFAFSDSSFTIRYFVSYIEHVDINGLSPYYEDLTW